MNSRFRNMIILCLSISIIVVCDAQESTEYEKLNTADDEKLQKQQESIEALMKQVGDMGMLVESYRRVIVNGITESNDICGFMENLSNPERTDDDNSLDRQDMAVRIYKQFFHNIDDPVLKTQLFATLENHLDECFNIESRPPTMTKRDKSQMQKIRFHSWGGKRNRGPQKIVIRTPFHAWGGKRSGDELI